MNKKENLYSCLNLFYQHLIKSKIEDTEKSNNLINKILEISYLDDSYKDFIINCCLETLTNNKDFVCLILKILAKFLTSANFQNDSILSKLLINDDYLMKSFCKNWIAFKSMTREINKSKIDSNTGKILDINSIQYIGNYDFTQNIKIRLDFIKILGSTNIWNNKIESMLDFLYKVMIEDILTEFEIKEFFKWINNSIQESNAINFKINPDLENLDHGNDDLSIEELTFLLFKNKICKDRFTCQTLIVDAFETFLYVFLRINEIQGYISTTRYANGVSLEVISRKDPEKLIGFDILWKIVFETKNEDIMNKGIETLHNLFSKVQIEDVEEVKNDHINFSDVLLKKCLDLIKSTEKSDYSILDKRNIIFKCLKFLKLIIEESERKGTARVKSHSALLKKKIVEIKVISYIPRVDDFKLRLYGNTTLWELKEIISKKVELGIDFLRIQIGNSDIPNSDHGKTLIDLNVIIINFRLISEMKLK